ncbi:MAG: GTP 3',8-cyclase MoaA [Thaumarchaeota archaeon]|nr:GTP 3',8-cyclase MoaA [Nitrososphaerota archaeon]
MGRYASKLRVSVTDRCNFRCDFCMPKEPVWIPRDEVLSFEEITRVATVLAQMGVTKVRVSGGEPLVRRDVEDLVGMLRGVPGIRAVSMTTNGALLKEKASALRAKGLSTITVSLHSLKPQLYHELTGTHDMFSRVMEGIKEAKRVGFAPIKVNCVVTKGCNEDEILDFATFAHDGGFTVRFIEYMPFDGTKLWDQERVVSGEEIIRRIEKRYELVPLEREHGSTAAHYRFRDNSEGEVGVITSMTKPFCSDCDRIRLKADGKIVPCLFSMSEFDLKPLLRIGASDSELSNFLRESFWLKSEGVESMLKDHTELKRIRPMYTIGG